MCTACGPRPRVVSVVINNHTRSAVSAPVHALWTGFTRPSLFAGVVAPAVAVGFAEGTWGLAAGCAACAGS